MITSYLKIALRNLFKYKLTSFINLFGLTIGLICCLAIIAYNANELSYDRYHKNAERVYRIATDWKWEGGKLNFATSSGPIAPLLKQNFPEIEKIARFFAEGTEFVKTGDNTIELSPIFSETAFFEIFDYTFLHGDPKSALSEPNSMVLSESAAVKIFGSADKAYGKTLEYINRAPQKVTGIIKDVPANSHFTFNAVGVLDVKADYINNIQDVNLYTYALLKKGTDIPQLEAKVKKLMARQMKDYKSDYSFMFQSLTSIYLTSKLQAEIGSNGNIEYLYIFSMVGVVILLLACINYINLATAQSSRRAKEVGVRKVMGSNKKQLIFQFFSESFLLVLAASLLSLIILQLITPLLTSIGGKQISFWDLGWLNVMMLMGGIIISVSVLSGLYPAIFLSKYSPAVVLKGVFGNSPSHAYFRKSLVVLQFTISIALIAFTIIVWQQLNFAMNKSLGFNKDQVLGVRVPAFDLRTKNLSAFKNKLASYPGILGTTSTTNQLGDSRRMSTAGAFFETNGMRPSSTNIIQKLGIDPEYLKLMEIPLKEGRNFSAGIPTDTLNSVIVNETLVKQRGWKNPIGKRVWNFSDDNNTVEAKVIGVVKDFHVGSMHKAIEPLMFYLASPEDSDNLYIKTKPESTKQTLEFIKKTYREFDNYNPFETYFLDQNFANQYLEDERKRSLFMLFSSLAMVLACLGLFGLSAFTIEQRTKEIGIRKVLGASIQNLLIMVTKDFVILVIIAFVVATPVALWTMDIWLQSYAYRVEIHWYTFAIAGISALLVAVITVGSRAGKAALANPVKSLRAE